MSKYKAQRTAKTKRREAEAASVRSKETAKVKHLTFFCTEGRTLPNVLTPCRCLPLRIAAGSGSRSLASSGKMAGLFCQIGGVGTAPQG